MACQERFFSLRELKKDYFRGVKLTESQESCLFMLSVGKKRGYGGRRGVLKAYSDFLLFFF